MGLAETSASARAASRFTSAVTRGLRESATIPRAMMALVLLMALLTYSPDDPGFSFTGNSAPVHNRIGVIGAWLADVLFFLFGRPAFLFPLVLGAACWGLQRRMKAQAAASRANTLVRIAGFVLVLVASCGLTTLHWQPGALRQTAGGVVGSVVGEGLVAGLDFLGATLVMIAAWMAGLSLAFGVSWLTIMDRLGALAWAGIGRLRTRSAAARDAERVRKRPIPAQASAPKRSMMVSQETPKASDRPAIQAAIITSVAPRKSSPATRPSPTTLPTTPPAVCRSAPGCQCSVVSPQLATSTSTNPAMRTRVLAREAAACAFMRRCRPQQAAPSTSGNRNAGRPKRKNSTSASHAPITPMRLCTGAELPVKENPGSSGL